MDDTLKTCSLQAEHSLEITENDSSEARAKELEAQFARENSVLPERFEVIDGNIFYLLPFKKSEKLIFVCSQLEVIACTRDEHNRNHGRLVTFPDVDGHMHEVAIPMELLASDGSLYRAQLLNRGLCIAPDAKARQLLSLLIQRSNPPLKVRCVNKIGWYQGKFVLPSEVIGNGEGEKILFQSPGTFQTNFSASGTLKEWKTHVGGYCRGNSRLLLSASLAFAPPLLEIVGLENGGLHLVGPSSLGKTTAQRIAVSVFFNPQSLLTWRATSNGLEIVAKEHNDCLLCLDELSQVDPDEAGNITYMLANGIDKLRSDSSGKRRESMNWRLLFFSTGEVGLALQMNAGGKRVRPGQEIRISEISADTGVYGIFENLHGFENGAALSQSLTQTCHRYHGTAGREFIKRFINDESGKSKVYEMFEHYRRLLVGNTTSGQVVRTAKRFALIATVGELATSYGITGWEEREAFWGVQKCFESWLERRGGGELKEEMYALAQVRLFFQQHGESRFSLWHDFEVNAQHQKTFNRAGFRKPHQKKGGWEYFVFKEVFENEICSGLDHLYVARVCALKGYLLADNEKRMTRSERLPGHEKSTRVYRFTSKVMEE